MAPLGAGEVIGSYWRETEGVAGGTVEPVEGCQVTKISQAEGDGIVAGAGEIKGLQGGEAGGTAGVGGRLVGHIGEVEAQLAYTAPERRLAWSGRRGSPQREGMAIDHPLAVSYHTCAISLAEMGKITPQGSIGSD